MPVAASIPLTESPLEAPSLYARMASSRGAARQERMNPGMLWSRLSRVSSPGDPSCCFIFTISLKNIIRQERIRKMITFEYSETFAYPAAAVFAALTDLEARPAWIAGILEVRVTPPGPARLGTSYFEAGKFSGFKSEKTLFVTEYEQDHLMTLATPAEASNPFRESYRIEPLSEETCSVH